VWATFSVISTVCVPTLQSHFPSGNQPDIHALSKFVQPVSLQALRARVHTEDLRRPVRKTRKGERVIVIPRSVLGDKPPGKDYTRVRAPQRIDLGRKFDMFPAKSKNFSPAHPKRFGLGQNRTAETLRMVSPTAPKRGAEAGSFQSRCRIKLTERLVESPGNLGRIISPYCSGRRRASSPFI